jgi:hypothetical protein
VVSVLSLSTIGWSRAGLPPASRPAPVAQNGSPKTAPLTLFVRIGLGGAVLATTNPLRRMTGRECTSDAIAEAQDRVGLGLGWQASGGRRRQQQAAEAGGGAMVLCGALSERRMGSREPRAAAYPGGDCTARRRQARQTRTSMGRGDVGHGTSDMGHGWAHVHARSSRNRYARDAATQQRSRQRRPRVVAWLGLARVRGALGTAPLVAGDESDDADERPQRQPHRHGVLAADGPSACLCVCVCCLRSDCACDCDCDCDRGCLSALVPISADAGLGWAGGLAGWRSPGGGSTRASPSGSWDLAPRTSVAR